MEEQTYEIDFKPDAVKPQTKNTVRLEAVVEDDTPPAISMLYVQKYATENRVPTSAHVTITLKYK